MNTTTGVIVVDHGSRREASNQMLLDAVNCWRDQAMFRIVEPAHMELAQPDIATAFARCVQQGAARIVVFPYFLSPGRHSTTDIPDLVAEAAMAHPGIEWSVAQPFGLHPALLQAMTDRIMDCDFSVGPPTAGS